MIRVAGLVILFLAAGIPMAKADFSQEIRYCVSDDMHPDIRIVACTRNIQSGRFIGSNLAVAFNNRGLAYAELSDYDRAIENCSAAISLEPGDPDYYDTRGKAYKKQGDGKRAEADFATARKLMSAQ